DEYPNFLRFGRNFGKSFARGRCKIGANKREIRHDLARSATVHPSPGFGRRNLFRPHGVRRVVCLAPVRRWRRSARSRFLAVSVRDYGERDHPRALRADEQEGQDGLMCRWAAYLGDEVFLEDIVTAPCHSLIAQSHHALEAKTPTNGDGFGVAWYGTRPEP